MQRKRYNKTSVKGEWISGKRLLVKSLRELLTIIAYLSHSNKRKSQISMRNRSE